ncbi:MAG: oligosaccharide flippase family protein [Burkholderiaceae bacterium]
MSSLKRNILASYASQIYVTLIGIVLIPLYLKYMGTEAYGLVGFFAMLQAWFNLLDLGLTPTIARESARYHGAAMSAVAYRRLYRSLSLVFMFIAVIGGGALFAMADVATNHWLNIRNLPPAEVLASVQVMAICVTLRWMGGLYRGVVTGSERLVWLSGFNAVIATLRFAGVLGSMWVWGFTPIVFFWHQLAVAALEVVGLLAMCHRLLPNGNEITERIGWSFRPIQPLLRFSLTIAFTSSVWVLVTQTDKLILSGILPLAEYGYFTMAVLVAGGITIISGPISLTIMPHMARLYAEGNHDEVRRIYNQGAQLVSVIAGSLAIMLIVCTESLLFAWTGNREVVNATAPILRLYAIGNGLLALGAFPYYLQYARGNLRYHLIGNLVLVVLLIPAIIVAAMKAGGVGAGWVWVAMNALYLIFWVGYVHSKLEPGLHWNWLASNVFVIFLPAFLVGLALSHFLPDVHSRLLAFAHTAVIATACMLVATMMSPVLRPDFLRTVRSRL